MLINQRIPIVVKWCTFYIQTWTLFKAVLHIFVQCDFFKLTLSLSLPRCCCPYYFIHYNTMFHVLYRTNIYYLEAFNDMIMLHLKRTAAMYQIFRCYECYKHDINITVGNKKSVLVVLSIQGHQCTIKFCVLYVNMPMNMEWQCNKDMEHLLHYLVHYNWKHVIKHVLKIQ